MRIVAILCLLTLAACARDTVTLLPGSSGSTGAVAVLQEDGQASAVIDQPYQVARVGDGRVSTETTSAEDVKKSYGNLLDALPPAPNVFILYFKEGSTELTDKSRPNLVRLLAEVDARQGAEVQVTGHTDTVGKIEDNDELSRKRAEAVRNTLISQGLSADLVIAVGRGERELLIATEDEVDEPQNRRVEVTVR